MNKPELCKTCADSFHARHNHASLIRLETEYDDAAHMSVVLGAGILMAGAAWAAPEDKQCPEASRTMLRQSAETKALIAQASKLSTSAQLCRFGRETLMPTKDRHVAEFSALRNACPLNHDNKILAKALADQKSLAASIAKTVRGACLEAGL